MPSDHRPILRAISQTVRKNATLGRLALKAIPDWQRTIRIDPIGPFAIRLRQHRSFWIRHPLTHERIMFAGLARLIAPGSVAHDVGGNIGLYARFMAQAFGAAKVITFEPMTANRALLAENIRIGGCESRITLLPYALSDHAGEAVLQIDTVQSGSAALDDVTHGRPSEGHEHYGLPAQTETVPLRRLDDLVASGEAPPPRFIKVDIEGAEAMFLRGAMDTLRTHRPRLAIELHGLDVAREVLTILDGQGYGVWSMVRRTTDDARTWERVTPATPDGLTRKYDLHHVFAEPAEAPPVLTQPLVPWHAPKPG
jgi:FkbM family methyltransferase